MDITVRLSVARSIAAFICIVAVDAVVLPAARNLQIYPRVSLAIPYALIAYAILAVVLGSLETEKPAFAGALVGFTVYGIFNGTELALRPDWRRWKTPLFDVTYGTAICAAAAAVAAAVRL